MRIRTGFSFHVAYGHLKDVASRLEEIGWDRQPISDTNATHGFSRWNKLVKNPIFGVELAVTPKLEEKKPVVDYWTFFAIDNLEPLHDIIGMATGKSSLRIPIIDYADAIKAPGLIKIMGNRVLLDRLEIPDGTPDLYMGLSPSLSMGLYKEAQKRNLNFIATSDNYYPRETDKETYRIGLHLRANTQTYPMHILSDEEWRNALWWIADNDKRAAIHNLRQAFKRCTATLRKAASLFEPKKPRPLREMCLENFEALPPHYIERMDRELKLIYEKKFEDYFYIIADIMRFARREMVVGPARGSSCGSLVCYLLGITTVDPIKYDLIFERFIDVNRSDLPDIDLDVSDAQRDRVFKYVTSTYGIDHVARLGTVGMFRAKSAANQAARALRIPGFKIDKLDEVMFDRWESDPGYETQLHDTLTETAIGRELVKEFPALMLATNLEAHPQAAGQHAAGICITKEPIAKFIAVDNRSKSVMCDKLDAENLGMLKIDILGLTQLSIFERTLQLIGITKRKEWNSFLNEIPLDDPEAFEIFNQRKYSGIFQFNGQAVQKLSNMIWFDHFEDIVAITSLARPGPLQSGGAELWAKRKAGGPIEYAHEIFEPYLKATLGVLTFQEQVMVIAREVGDMSWEDVSKLRRAISRSKGREEIDQFGDIWKPAAIRKGVPAHVANKFWNDICEHGAYSFNRAHAVAYAMDSYYCAWFKAHHQLEFAAATLDAETLTMRQIHMLRELDREGVDFLTATFDPEKSGDKWQITDHHYPEDGREAQVLVAPLTTIRHIGPKKVLTILEHRANKLAGREISLPANLEKLLTIAETELDTIYPVREFLNVAIEIHGDLWNAYKIKTAPTFIKDIDTDLKGEIVAIGIVMKMNVTNENEPEKVARRGRKLRSDQATAMNVQLADDTGEIFCKISAKDYETIGKAFDNATLEKSVYAIKGKVLPFFRLIMVSGVKYLGEIDEWRKLERGEVEEETYAEVG